MLQKLTKPSRKKIKKARTVYEVYCKVNTLEKTREATGLAINTIRRYIALAEDLNDRGKLSTKDRYYNNIYKDNNTPIAGDNIINNDKPIPAGNISDTPYIYNNNIYNKDIDINNDNNDGDAKTNTNVPSIKETKNKILLSKLDSISSKYLDYLRDPSKERLEKTSLKDRAVIAGILLDKKILMEHKQADVIKNQSIIFNLFGNNKNLASFIADVTGRQKKLSSKPLKKYTPAEANNT